MAGYPLGGDSLSITKGIVSRVRALITMLVLCMRSCSNIFQLFLSLPDARYRSFVCKHEAVLGFSSFSVQKQL